MADLVWLCTKSSRTVRPSPCAAQSSRVRRLEDLDGLQNEDDYKQGY